MNKEDFKKAVCAKLKKIPMEDRREWEMPQLLIWWEQEKGKDAYLHCGTSGASDWALVKMCTSDYIGKDAIW